jgi:hypothetical protein
MRVRAPRKQSQIRMLHPLLSARLADFGVQSHVGKNIIRAKIRAPAGSAVIFAQGSDPISLGIF